MPKVSSFYLLLGLPAYFAYFASLYCKGTGTGIK